MFFLAPDGRNGRVGTSFGDARASLVPRPRPRPGTGGLRGAGVAGVAPVPGGQPPPGGRRRAGSLSSRDGGPLAGPDRRWPRVSLGHDVREPRRSARDGEARPAVADRPRHRGDPSGGRGSRGGVRRTGRPARRRVRSRLRQERMGLSQLLDPRAAGRLHHARRTRAAARRSTRGSRSPPHCAACSPGNQPFRGSPGLRPARPALRLDRRARGARLRPGSRLRPR